VKLNLRGSARAFERRMVVGIQIDTYAEVRAWIGNYLRKYDRLSMV
jgi:hypothetical protein